MKYYVYTYLIYSQKLIVKPEVIDSLIRAIAIKLTRQKKTRSSPIPSPLKTNTLYHRSSFQILVQKKRNKKKKETNPETKPNTLPLHHLATPSTIPCQTQRRPPHIAPPSSPCNTVLILYATRAGGE